MSQRKKTSKNYLSLIVPAYKQAKTIKKDLTQIKKSMMSLKIPFELIVVIDGKLDKTERILKKAKLKKVKVVGYLHNHGKGYAIRYGMSKAKGNIIAFLDAGMDLDPEDFKKFLQIMQNKNADVVIGSKLHKQSIIVYPWQRKILSWGYRTTVKLLFSLSVSDTQVGMKLFKRDVLEDVLPRLLVKQYAFDIEILAVSNYLGYKRIFEAPIRLTFNKWSSITSKNFIKFVVKMLWDTFAVFYRLRILKYYDDNKSRQWKYDPELNFRINTGKVKVE